MLENEAKMAKNVLENEANWSFAFQRTDGDHKVIKSVVGQDKLEE
jgi:hypothetical protein